MAAPPRAWKLFATTYAITLATWGSMLGFGIDVAPRDDGSVSPLGFVLLLIGGSAPSIAGVFLTWRDGGRDGLARLWRSMWDLRLGWRLWLVVLCVPLVVRVAQVVALLSRGEVLDLSPLIVPALERPVLLVPTLALTMFAGPISEELGWRGYAQAPLSRRLGGVGASLVMGVCWAAWHLPLFLIPGTPQHALHASYPVFFCNVIGMTFLFTHVHRVSRGSVGAAIVLHWLINLGINALPIPDLPLEATVGIAAWLLVAIVVSVGERRARPD